MKEIKTLNMYKPVTGWLKFDPVEGQNPDITMLAIGEAVYTDKTSEYVKEPIYTALLEDIQEDRRMYAIHVLAGKIPQLFITSQGSILLHNEDMETLVSAAREVMDALSSENVSLICDAELECGPNTAPSQRYSLMEVTAKISRQLDMELPAEFVRSLVCETITKLNAGEVTPVAKYLAGLDSVVITQIAGELNKSILTKKVSGKMTTDIIKKLNTNPNTLYKALRNELFIRTATHRMHGTQ